MESSFLRPPVLYELVTVRPFVALSWSLLDRIITGSCRVFFFPSLKTHRLRRTLSALSDLIDADQDISWPVPLSDVFPFSLQEFPVLSSLPSFFARECWSRTRFSRLFRLSSSDEGFPLKFFRRSLIWFSSYSTPPCLFFPRLPERLLPSP